MTRKLKLPALPLLLVLQYTWAPRVAVAGHATSPPPPGPAGQGSCCMGRRFCFLNYGRFEL
jgi:hypothetical protein